MLLDPMIVCPTCLAGDAFSETEDKQQHYVVCGECSGVFPIYFDTPYLVDFRSLLDTDPDYLASWHISQVNAMSLYRANDPASLAHIDRDDVQQVMGYMDLRDKVVLDLGSGIFTNPEYITTSQAKKIFCLDPIVPESKPEFSFIGGMAEFLPFADKSVDVVTFITSLDHVIDVDSSLREVERVLKDDGIMYLWIGFTEDKALLGHPPKYALLQRNYRKKNQSLEAALSDYHQSMARYQDQLQAYEAEPGENSALLVDQFHLRHFEKVSFQKQLNCHGLELLTEQKIHYPGDAFNDFWTVKKYHQSESDSFTKNNIFEMKFQMSQMATQVNDMAALKYRIDELTSQVNQVTTTVANQLASQEEIQRRMPVFGFSLPGIKRDLRLLKQKLSGFIKSCCLKVKGLVSS